MDKHLVWARSELGSLLLPPATPEEEHGEKGKDGAEGGGVGAAAATGTEQLELAQAVGARQQVLGEHRPPFVLRILGGGCKRAAGPHGKPFSCYTAKAKLGLPGEGAAAGAASLRAEGFSQFLGSPKTPDCSKAPLQRGCARWAGTSPGLPVQLIPLSGAQDVSGDGFPSFPSTSLKTKPSFPWC